MDILKGFHNSKRIMTSPYNCNLAACEKIEKNQHLYLYVLK